MQSALFLAFFLGGLTTLLAEAVLILILLFRFTRRRRHRRIPFVFPRGAFHRTDTLDSSNLLHHEYNMQGVVWVLESNKLPAESKKKKDMLVSSLEQRHAKVEGHSLSLTGSDGYHTIVQLKGCVVLGVSASESSSKKWAKRYPIKIESQSSPIYDGSKILYIFCENSWWKESWCRALRFASFSEDERANWHLKLSGDFISYLTSLKSIYPFLKPFVGIHSEPSVMGNKRDEPSSRAHMFWQKYKRKLIKAGLENKLTAGNILSRSDDMKVKDNDCSIEKSFAATGFSSTLVLSQSEIGKENHNSPISRTETNEVPIGEDGAVFWNLLLSRLFFDFKSSSEFNIIFELHVQRILSNMRTPSYIGDVICMGFHIGDFPPYIHDMKAVSIDINGLCTLDIDIEYSGGAVLDIETRLDVHSVDLRTSIADKSLGSDSERVFASDCFDEFEHFREELKSTDDVQSVSDDHDHPCSKQDDTDDIKGCTQESSNPFQWKSLLNSIARKVSDVPLSMAVRVDSFRGTLRLQVKPPPSNRLWFGFTSVPDIKFTLESSVGDHKITGNKIASVLVNRIKASINNTLVIPNCESICIPWMFEDKDDWLPRSEAPIQRVDHEVVSGEAADPVSAPSSEGRKVSNTVPNMEKKQRRSGSSDGYDNPIVYPVPPVDKHLISASPSPSPELITPLLKTSSDSSFQSQNVPPRAGRRARMMDLGKRMGDKFDEKRKHFEDRSKSFVDRFRGQ